MSFQANTAFVQHYTSNVMMLLQQTESRFEAAVQIRPFYGKAASVVEQFGQSNAVRITSRHADTVLSSTPHDKRWVFPLDYAWAEMTDEADLLLIAPATANTLAKLALGLADDALSCIALALEPRSKVLIAPAMNGKMWLHPATQGHVATLKARGAGFIGPEAGMLSCGYEGVGRLWPVDLIAARALELLA